jgi:hypothetical protein
MYVVRSQFAVVGARSSDVETELRRRPNAAKWVAL